MKVALVQMPVWWVIDPPLGLAQLAGCLKAAGHEPVVFDVNIELWKTKLPQYTNMWQWEQFHFWNTPDIVNNYFTENITEIDRRLENILESDAPIIGFSVTIGSQWTSLKMSQMIKKKDPSRLVVWGGQYFFLEENINAFIRCDAVDVIMRGGADETFPRLVSDWQTKRSLHSCSGIVYKENGRMMDGGWPAPLPDLDRLPFADFTVFPLENYTDSMRIPMAASRGCVWNRHFCSTCQFWQGYTAMSGDRIFSEVLHHRKKYPNRTHIDFYDVAANGQPDNMLRFSLLVEESHGRSSLMEIGWKINAVIRPEMTPETMQVYRSGGCTEIIYGIESGSPRVLKMMNKNYDLKVAEQVLRATHEAGIITTANFMFGHPGETEVDFEKTLEFMKRCSPYLDKVYGSATFTSLEENSYLTKHSAEFGIKKAQGKVVHSLYWETDDEFNTYPIRMDRYLRFRKMAAELGLDVYKGIDGALENEKLSKMAEYFQYTDHRLQAANTYINYLSRDSHNAAVKHAVGSLSAEYPKLRTAFKEYLKWKTKYSHVSVDVQKALWDKSHQWFTDDKPFALKDCPCLEEWLHYKKEYIKYVQDTIRLHGFMQNQNCHAFLRWDDNQIKFFCGKDVVDNLLQLDILSREVKGLIGKDDNGSGDGFLIRILSRVKSALENQIPMWGDRQ